MRGAVASRGLCLLVPLVLSCGGSASPTFTTPDAAPGEAGMNACGGGAVLTFQGKAAAPAASCGTCGDGVLVCASPDVLACSGARPSSSCPDATVVVDAATASDSNAEADVHDVMDATTAPDVEPAPDAPDDVALIDATVDAEVDAAVDAAVDVAVDAGADQDAATVEAGAVFVWPTCSAADGGDAASDAGASGDDASIEAGAADGGARALQQVFAGATWSVGQSVAGMAVDDQGRVYLADANNVYVYVCGRLLIYMTAAEAAAIVGGSSTDQIQDMDMAPDGSLYILLWRGIVHSTAPHRGTLFQSTSSLTFPHRLGAIANDRVAVTHRGGLTAYTPSSGSLVYSASQIGSPSDCAVEDLTTDRSGVFLYNVGCNGSPLIRGNVDGSGVWILSTTSALNAFNFICSARDPTGGFYTVITDQNDKPHLYHVDEMTTGTQAFTEVTTSPTLIQAEASQSETFAFLYCSLATAPDGTVFFQTMSQLWKVTP